MRSKPVDAAASGRPFINLSLGLKSLILSFGARALRLDLPIAFCDSLQLKDDPRGLAHAWQYAAVRHRPLGPVKLFVFQTAHDPQSYPVDIV